jgi:hypothetical protein
VGFSHQKGGRGEFLKPHVPSRDTVLETVNDTKRFRNPVVLPAVKGSWPNPQTENAKDLARGIQIQSGEFAHKNRP